MASEIEQELFLDRFNADSESHIHIKDREVCVSCASKWCTIFCPASVFVWDETAQEIVVGYEGCLECGLARIGCPYDNIAWRPPRGGYGVQYKNG